MHIKCRVRAGIAGVCLVAVLAPAALVAQEPPRPAPPAQAVPAGRGAAQSPPQFTSAEITADRRITFRVFAPRAQAVRVAAGDIPGTTPAVGAMAKAENGVWEVTVGPVPPGAYRYNFNIDGVATIDPRSSAISESNTNVWSLVVVPGNDAFDTKNVPRGAVAAVTYWSTALGTFRRMHVYTPPGYELGEGQYPVFYLLHGAGDNDHAWSSVGRAGFILDNLIAARKARPMVVVMPAGHTPRATGASSERPRRRTSPATSCRTSCPTSSRITAYGRIAPTRPSQGCRWAGSRRWRSPFPASDASDTSGSSARG